MADLKNVEIFGAGTWNEMKFVTEDLEEIVTNTVKLFEKGTSKPPLKLGHSTNQILQGQDDGDPNLGRVENFRLKGDKIIADFINMPDIIYQTIEAGRFTKVSVEMNHVRHFGWFITGVALLGADLPAVKTLDDLQAFLSEEPKDLGDQDVSIILNKMKFSEPNFVGEKPMAKENANTPETPVVNVSLSNDEDLKQEIKRLQNVLKEKEALQSQMSDMETKLQSFKEKEVERNFNDKKANILAIYDEDVKAGRLLPSIRDEIEKHLDSQKSKFTEDSELTISPELTRKVAESYKLEKEEKAGDNHDTDKNPVNASEAFKRKVLKLASNEGISYKEATDKLFELEPEAYEQYADWAENVHAGRV